MGRRGIAPKPKGTYSLAGACGAEAPSPTKPEWLRELGGVASGHWDDVVDSMQAEDPNWLRATDCDLLAFYCALYADFVDADDALSRRKAFVPLNHAIKALGMSPADRARVTLPTPKAKPKPGGARSLGLAGGKD